MRSLGERCTRQRLGRTLAPVNLLLYCLETIHRERNVSKSNTGNDTGDGSGLMESPDRPGVYRVTYDPDGAATISDTVIEAVAEVAGVDPTNTIIPLSDRIDPDALDALFADCEGKAQTTFRVSGLEVLVRSDGRVRIVDESVSDTE